MEKIIHTEKKLITLFTMRIKVKQLNIDSGSIETIFNNHLEWFYAKYIFLIIIFKIGLVACKEPKIKKEHLSKEQIIVCNTEFCKGAYFGPEFITGSDIAHQHSNKMSTAVGDKLNELYDNKLYSKVDFENIEMTTKGMGSGTVTFDLKIPFIRVESKCNAYTSFDHVGGWNHVPELNNRKKQLATVLLKNDLLNISNLKTTAEGLQEYWIQWRNKDKQSDCSSRVVNTES